MNHQTNSLSIPSIADISPLDSVWAIPFWMGNSRNEFGKMDRKQFINDYREAFGEAATLPIVFWHSDLPVAEPKAVNGCFFPAFE